MIETVNARLDLHGYTVTDFLTEPQDTLLPVADHDKDQNPSDHLRVCL